MQLVAFWFTRNSQWVESRGSRDTLSGYRTEFRDTRLKVFMAVKIWEYSLLDSVPKDEVSRFLQNFWTIIHQSVISGLLSLYFWDGARLSPLAKSATLGPTAAAPAGDDDEYSAVGLTRIDRGTNVLGGNLPNTISSTASPTWSDLESVTVGRRRLTSWNVARTGFTFNSLFNDSKRNKKTERVRKEGKINERERIKENMRQREIRIRRIKQIEKQCMLNWNRAGGVIQTMVYLTEI